ncbi:MAG: sugar transferase [Patescibacteria group bacterium]
MLIAAGIAAYFLRFQTFVSLRPVLFEIPFAQFFAYLVGVSLVFLCVFALSGLYRMGHTRIRNEIQKLATACSASVMLVIVFIFFIQELFTSRFIVLAFWVLSFVCIVSGRALLRVIRRWLFRRGIGLHSLAIIGSGDSAHRFRDEISRRKDLGYAVTGIFSSFSKKSVDDLETLIARNQLDELIVLETAARSTDFPRILDFSNTHHVGLRYSADLVKEKKFLVGTLAGIPFVEIKRTSLEGWGRVSKRIFDVVGSLILILATLPLMVFCAIVIRLESSGSPLYKNERVGQNGKRFFAYKFRSMYAQYCTGARWDPTGAATAYELKLAQEKSERHGPVFKVLNDPRRTRVGRFLERFSLDELPQLFNVLNGTMSLVGPRPHMPIQVQNYENNHHQLFSIRPGITGMAQVEGRSDLDFNDEARLDIFYMENWSVMLDAVILLKTPLVVLSRKSRV